MARKRKKAEEEGEVEANLIPIMNIMFLLIPALLLAMEVASFSAINVRPPSFAAQANKKEEEKKDEKPLNLKVWVLEDGFRVSAQGQQQGAEAGKSADSTKPTIPLAKAGAPLEEYDRWDYAKLEAEAKKYKDLFPHETVVTLGAETNIPLQAIINTMDALRGSECKLIKVYDGGEEVPPECRFFQPLISDGAG
jgi:biopolymer transport protein ExbD